MNGIKNADLKRRILDISYKYHLSHIGSNLTAVDIIEEIYSLKKLDEKFILSSGHAGLALYCVLEKYFDLTNGKANAAGKIFDHHGIHPDRCVECMIDCSSGSLGHGLGIATGMALADRTKNVYCLVSDGECAEGSVYEALRIATENKLKNLKVYINANGWGAYKKIDDFYIDFAAGTKIVNTNMDGYPGWLQDQQAHYVIMNEEKYKEALSILQ